MGTRATVLAVCVLLMLLAGIGWWYTRKTSSGTATPGQVIVSSVSYDSPSDGISFTYPASYKLEEHSFEMNAIKGKYLTLVPADAVVPEAGEGPPGITVEIFDNPKKTPLAQWLKTITNGTPAPAQGWDYADVKVGGEQATAYSASGLYESDNVAVAHGTHVYVFSAAWQSRTDKTLSDLQALLTSVQFNK